MGAKCEPFARRVQLLALRDRRVPAGGGQKKSGLVAPQPAKRGVFGTATAWGRGAKLILTPKTPAKGVPVPHATLVPA